MDIIPEAPLFRDPIFDGAADPTIIYNDGAKEWWIFYTARRAFSPNHGVSYCHGSRIGIASSKDGRRWTYRGTAQGLEFEPGHNTFWAPEVIRAKGAYYMYCTYVRGVPSSWDGEREIVCYKSEDLWNWEFLSVVPLSSRRVIDACLYETQPGLWKMWYKDEAHQSATWAAESHDLLHWRVLGPEVERNPHEGPNVFVFGGKKWMLTDAWNGMDLYLSGDFSHWEYQSTILREGGSRPDDGTIGNHGDVLVSGGRAFIFYFTHPEMSKEEREDPAFIPAYRHRRTSLQAAELTLSEDEKICCDRDHVRLCLIPPEAD